jgi:DNA-binding Lrp family transcriptional regulator
MQQAYVLVNAEPGALWHIASSAHSVKGVKMAHAVTGFCDVIIYAEIADQTELGDLIHRIRTLRGVTRTQTSVVLPLPSYQL